MWMERTSTGEAFWMISARFAMSRFLCPGAVVP